MIQAEPLRDATIRIVSVPKTHPPAFAQSKQNIHYSHVDIIVRLNETYTVSLV